MVMEDGTMAVEAEERQFRWCLDPIREVLSPEVVVVVVLASHGYPGLLMVIAITIYVSLEFENIHLFDH